MKANLATLGLLFAACTAQAQDTSNCAFPISLSNPATEAVTHADPTKGRKLRQRA